MRRYKEKVETNTELLISRMQTIIALSASTSAQEIQASEMLQIESNASMIVRLVEELLSISRNLKESWILGQLPKSEQQQDVVTQEVQGKVDALLQKILQSKHYNEEIGLDEEFEKEEQEEDTCIKIEQEEKIPDELILPVETDSSVVKQEPPEVAPHTAEIKQEQEEKEEEKLDADEDLIMKDGLPVDTSQLVDPMDMSDGGATNVLGDYDFDNFGNMDRDDDIMMG